MPPDRTPLPAPEAEPAAGRPPSTNRTWGFFWSAVALALVLAGFFGLDRWFYEQVSLTLNRSDTAIQRDFYHSTKLFWEFWRWAVGTGVGGIVLGIVLVVLEPRRWRAVVAALATVAIVGLVANIAQGAIGRLRPNQADTHLAFTQPFAELLTKQRVCFPSGEASTAFALACVLTRLLPRWRIVFCAAAALAAAARLVNGAHYVSDVAAGALLGWAAGAFVYRSLRRGVLRDRAPLPRAHDRDFIRG